MQEDVDAILAQEGLVDPDAAVGKDKEMDFPLEMQRAILAATLTDLQTGTVAATGLSSKAYTQRAHKVLAQIAHDHIKAYKALPTREYVLYEFKKQLDDQKAWMTFEAEARVVFDYCPEIYTREFLADRIREFSEADLMRRGMLGYFDSLKKGEPDLDPVRLALGNIDKMKDQAKGRRGYLIKDLFQLPAMSWVVEKHLTEGGFSCVYGEYESGKTFIGLDLALCIATGKSFLGKFPVHKPGAVAYIVGEGHGGIRKRIFAWMNHYGVEDIPNFVLIPAQFNMLDSAEAQAVVDTAVEQLGCYPSHIFFDTLTKMFGSGDSSSSKDMTAYVNNLLAVQEIGRRNNTPLAVVSIHHTGKDKTRGSLGSVVLPGACDSMIEVSGDVAKVVHVHCHKQKDGSKFSDYDLVMKAVGIPGEIDPSGEGSLVLVRKSGQFEALTEAEEDALLTLHRKFGSKPFTWTQGAEAQEGKRSKKKGGELVNRLAEKLYLLAEVKGPYQINPEAETTIARLSREQQSADEDVVGLVVRAWNPSDVDEIEAAG